MAGQTLPERVAQIYYTYGLFCSSYPLLLIGLAFSLVLLCCFPLLNLPLPGNIPTVIQVPLDVHREAHSVGCNSNICLSADPVFEALDNETQKLPFIWAKKEPMMYVHQIIIKTGVSPWLESLKTWDAFRAPLQEVFRLLETIRNHEDPETKETLSDICYQVDNVKKWDSKPGSEPVLPEYSCLLLSPANLWHQNLQQFSLDTNIISTIFNHHHLQKGKVSVSEMAWGMQMKDAGIKRYPLRARARLLQFAVTVCYSRPPYSFIRSLNKKLRDLYPLHQHPPPIVNEATLIYYPGEFNYHELVPLCITFIGIFLYVYFSVRKIESIKSKFGLAACSVLTIAASLSMSMGICFYFGFSLSLQGKEIFPYLVIIVGLENVLVLTKSVTTTDTRLDVKIRLAQGLSREGWSITKNLLTEITIFTLSFFTFVPFIQEFSIFMIVSLISDYFIQMAFFATVLGIDVHRMECFQEKNNKLHLKDYFISNYVFNSRFSNGYAEVNSPLKKSKSHPRLNGLAHSTPTNVVAKRNSAPKHLDPVPKRIQLVNLWARTRFFQRAFMVWMLVWISMIVYNSGVVEYFVSNAEREETDRRMEKSVRQSAYELYNANANNLAKAFLPLSEPQVGKTTVDVNDTLMLKHSPHSRPWTRLSPYHWSSMLSQYNSSVWCRYVVYLPPSLLSHRVSPELAIGLRNPDEKEPPPLRWQALALALDPIDIRTELEKLDVGGGGSWGQSASELPIYPTTPMEILLLAILCTISVAVIAYMMVVVYRCVCSRNYAEWRASWSEKDENKVIYKEPAVQLVMEAVPIVVSGHSHEVECLVTDGERVVSSCLQGTIKIWDSHTGEHTSRIHRNAYFKLQNELSEKVNSLKYNSQCNGIEVEALSPLDVGTKRRETIHKLRTGLTDHLSGLRFRTVRNSDLHLSDLETTKYDFAKSYRELYCSDRDDVYVDQNYDTIEKANHRPYHTTNHRLNSIKSINNVDKCNNIAFKNKNRTLVSDSDSTEDVCVSSKSVSENNLVISPIWCMDLCNDLLILGCADGRVEFWEASSGKLLCIYWCAESIDSRSRGVTHARAIAGARRIALASLSGRLTLLRLEARSARGGCPVDWRFSSAHRRKHKRTGSAGSIRSAGESAHGAARMSLGYEPELSDNEEVECVRIAQCRAHQQPISEMHCEGGRILTGGHDHVLKVFSSEDLSPLLTLHGHCGPVTSCFIEHATPNIAGSGSQDGLLCVWDLHTGACLYSIQAHDGAVTSLAYTASYVISCGSDERLCVWDRFQGHMLNSIHVGLNYMSRMLPLTHSLLLMGDRGGLVVYDLSRGDVIRRVLLGENDGCVFVRQILPLKDAVVCDYANQLRIIRFPLVPKLSDMKME